MVAVGGGRVCLKVVVGEVGDEWGDRKGLMSEGCGVEGEVGGAVVGRVERAVEGLDAKVDIVLLWWCRGSGIEFLEFLVRRQIDYDRRCSCEELETAS